MDVGNDQQPPVLVEPLALHLNELLVDQIDEELLGLVAHLLFFFVACSQLRGVDADQSTLELVVTNVQAHDYGDGVPIVHGNNACIFRLGGSQCGGDGQSGRRCKAGKEARSKHFLKKLRKRKN